MTKLWVIRAGRGGELINEFLKNKVAAIGWDKVGTLDQYNDRETLLSSIMSAWPEYKKNKAAITASHLFRFAHDIKSGDRVLTYDTSRRIYWLGSVIGKYKYSPGTIETFPHILPVDWEKEVKRDVLSVSTKNRLGSIATLFLVAEDAALEVLKVASGQEGISAAESEEVESDEEYLLEDIIARSREFIKDRLNALDWDEMQEIVAGLLRAMGYKTKISRPGSDRGKDIVASRDGLGFEQPRIIVEVKHREKAMGAPEIRNFIAGRHESDKCLYVSTNGFSKEAQYEAERAKIPVTLMDLDELADSILEHYEQLEPDLRALIPLRKVYWPV